MNEQDRLLSSIKAKEQREYEEYKNIRIQARELDTIKRNVDQLLSVPPKEERGKNQERG